MEKTCGNCDSWRTVGIERGYCIFDNSLEDGCLKLHLRDDAACDKHTNAPLPLEQRYQQLAEVARDMLKFLKNIEREYPRLLDPNRKPGGQILYPMPSDEYANQLEELGVEV